MTRNDQVVVKNILHSLWRTDLTLTLPAKRRRKYGRRLEFGEKKSRVVKFTPHPLLPYLLPAETHRMEERLYQAIQTDLRHRKLDWQDYRLFCLIALHAEKLGLLRTRAENIAELGAKKARRLAKLIKFNADMNIPYRPTLVAAREIWL